ncbi:MAG TPA: Gfo/Idh/MocA family oxidoreductase [Acidobacteriota bacterium]|nr:Gfo/Idh/MocA family oxidoreductase [Acidobacteriota bacterium]
MIKLARFLLLLTPLAAGRFLMPWVATESQSPLRVGIIGTDTSHATAFTQMLNDPSRPDHVPGTRVVAAFKGGSPDVESSATRVDRFAAELKDKWKVELVNSIEELCRRVDAVLLESVDGRPHLEQVRPVFAAKKRVFIDKPLAASLHDAREIARLSRESGTPFFTSSSLRFVPEIQALKNNEKLGAILGATAYGPAPLEPHHPDLFWYGIHTVEILYTLMGPGCTSVMRAYTDGADVVVGRWMDGRLGVVRGIRKGAQSYGAIAFGSKAVVDANPSEKSPYHGLVVEIVKFFQTGNPPLPPEESLEMFAFMQAADVSKARNGAVVSLKEVQ